MKEDTGNWKHGNAGTGTGTETETGKHGNSSSQALPASLNY